MYGYSDNQNRASTSSGGQWVGTIPLRIGSALILLYLHTWQQAVLGWHYLWHQQPWDLPGLITKASLPYHDILAISAATIGISVTVSWILGFLTRFFSFIFIPVILGVLLAANRLGEYTIAETAMLYLLISLTLLITGSGWISADALFKIKRIKKKR